MTNNALYWDIVQLSNKILIRRHQLAGRCYRHKQRRTSAKIRPVDTHLWQGKQGKQGQTYNNLICDILDVEVADLPSLLSKRLLWKRFVKAQDPSDQ